MDHGGYLFYSRRDVFLNRDQASSGGNGTAVEFTVSSLCGLLSCVPFVNVVLYAREYIDYKNFNMYFLVVPNYSSSTLLEVM